MAAGHGDSVDHFPPQLVGHLAQFGIGQPTEVCGNLNFVKQRGFRGLRLGQ
jgi:hypothetical protein